MAWRLPLWPRSLGGRTAVFLLAALTLVQTAGLTIHALDRVDLQRLGQLHEVAQQAIGAYRTVMLAPIELRADVAREIDLSGNASVVWGPVPMIGVPPLPPTDAVVQRQLRADMLLVPMPLSQRPRDYIFLGGPAAGKMAIALRLPSGNWVTVLSLLPAPRPWHSGAFLGAFLLMSGAAAILTLWAVRRLTGPVETLAAAAEALGRDVNAKPLPEGGPSEVATAAAAFNTMAARIRRFVEDRTFMLTAIGHDLRTPITRLKLRAEFVDDDELRTKMLGDLDQLEAMVGATLAFGRDVALQEQATRVDLVALIRTVLDETADAQAEELALGYEGVDSLAVLARPMALKRALTNLVINAVNYGGGARVHLHAPADGVVRLDVEDDGPGIPDDELQRVFLPFHRVDASRNNDRGGMGLGLPIARNILRAHGGDVAVANRAEGGLRVTVTLPL